LDDYKLGRAEYENVTDCFEGIPASKIMRPLYQNDDTKMLLGERGIGKTHLIKLLSKEIPVDVYSLDKLKLMEGKVSYFKSSSCENPKLTFIDDVHYLTKFMHMLKLDGYKVDERKYIDGLVMIAEESRRKGSIPVFISDDGPYGLSSRFEEENRADFLKVLDKCVADGFDAEAFYSYLGEFYPVDNVIHLSHRGVESPAQAYHFRNMYDKVLTLIEDDDDILKYKNIQNELYSLFTEEDVIEEGETKQIHNLFIKPFDPDRYTITREARSNETLNKYQKNAVILKHYPIAQSKRNMIRTFDIRDIPLCYNTKGRDEAQYIYDIHTNRGCKGTVLNGNVHSLHGALIIPDRLIATPRQLKMLKDEYDNISIKTLFNAGPKKYFSKRRFNLKHGEKTGLVFSGKDIMKIKSRLNKTYEGQYNISKEFKDTFADSNASDSEVHSAMIKNMLAQE